MVGLLALRRCYFPHGTYEKKLPGVGGLRLHQKEKRVSEGLLKPLCLESQRRPALLVRVKAPESMQVPNLYSLRYHNRDIQGFL